MLVVVLLQWVVVSHEGDVAEVEGSMAGVVFKFLVLVGRHQVHCEFHLLRIFGSVGGVGDVLLIECVVAFVSQTVGYRLAVEVEGVSVEGDTGFHLHVCGVGKNETIEGGVGDIEADAINEMAFSESDIIVYADFLLVESAESINIDAGVQIAFVGEGNAELLCRSEGEIVVVDNWCRAYAAYPPVEPVGAVTAGDIIDGELKFYAPKNLMVRLLTQVVDEVGLFHHLFLIDEIDFHVVEEQLTIRHVLSGATRNHRQ